VSRSGRRTTYRDAGVDIDAADELVARIKRLARTTHGPDVLSGIGLFAAAVKIPSGYRRPVLLSSTDGVGTKLLVAQLAGVHDTVGVDLVAMNANDLLTSGARPLFFLDYIAVGSLRSVATDDLIKGIVAGCKQAGMSLVGGETAEMPGVYEPGVYDLAGFALGVAERKQLLDGSRVRAGDAVIALESNGLHSNGYSLARKALGIDSRRALRRRLHGASITVGEELLRPTRIYVKPVLAALQRFSIHAMAHVTGGGLSGNLVRVLPARLRAVIEHDRLPRLPIFDVIQQAGRISDREMERTFNCGTGYVIVADPRDAEPLCAFLRRRRCPSRVVGAIRRGTRAVDYT